MQRQSLGSPNSKLSIHGDVAGGGAAVAEEVDETKSDKMARLCSRSERSIHLIPLLTLLCLLVLYLFSHDPSASDLASIGGAVRVLDRKEVLGVEGRSFRGLKAATKPRRRHRKLGGFL
ncbi:hypothetical protein J5N97_018807 [Dioscorea zingiberensis]|uniref:Uncharacterized protein n=1 Tax=Dioscorea zingiberensis TaxID=325984 RepID=A0A9D5HC93_9LILI|nr:hypothetical protein J5N97_018807 [Dioscorea zingiberensis]